MQDKKPYTPIKEHNFITYFFDNKNIGKNVEEEVTHHMEQVKCEMNYYIMQKYVQWSLGHASTNIANAYY